jgi:hypothetical protein
MGAGCARASGRPRFADGVVLFLRNLFGLIERGTHSEEWSRQNLTLAIVAAVFLVLAGSTVLLPCRR